MVKNLDDVVTLTTPVHTDNRGYFAESWNKSWQQGIDLTVAQTNVCWSEHRNTLRGLHAQYGGADVAKLVRVIHGEILDVYVDARLDSETYGEWRATKLANLGQAIYIPRGFYHGYVTLTDNVLVTYHQDSVHNSKLECGLNFQEAGELFWQCWNIDTTKLLVSDKDRAQPGWDKAVKF